MLQIYTEIKKNIYISPSLNSHYSKFVKVIGTRFGCCYSRFHPRSKKTLFVVQLRMFPLRKMCLNVKLESRIVFLVLLGDNITCNFIFGLFLLSGVMDCFHER